MPAICVLGVPVLPVVDPGEAVSPGTMSCNLTNAAGLTVILGLVLAVLAPSVMSVAVSVREPEVFNVTLRVFVPLTSAEFDGNVAFGSDEVMPTVSLAVLTTFQFASTALIMMLKGVAAVWAVGVPVLPVELPGAAVSPGTRSCSFTNAAVFTVIAELVFVPMLA